MSLSMEETLRRLKKSYEVYCDVEDFENHPLSLKTKYTLNVRSEKYVLSKKAVIWSAESDEHIYVFSTQYLTKNIFDQCQKYALEEGSKLVNPKSGHMCTYITAIFVCENADEDAENAVKKSHFYKSFLLSLHGWMELHTGLIKLENKRVITNRAGKRNLKFLKEVIHV